MSKLQPDSAAIHMFGFKLTHTEQGKEVKQTQSKLLVYHLISYISLTFNGMKVNVTD